MCSNSSHLFLTVQLVCNTKAKFSLKTQLFCLKKSSKNHGKMFVIISFHLCVYFSFIFFLYIYFIFSIHQAFKEIILAKSQNLVGEDLYKKMLTTMCSKLSALPVCVMAWISNYKYALPSSKINFNQGNNKDQKSSHVGLVLEFEMWEHFDAKQISKSFTLCNCV